MAKPLKPHHAAWLAKSPHRTEAWLRAKLIDGFDVHHLDGDHANNDPQNLMLIEHVDHMFLHGSPVMAFRFAGRQVVDRELAPQETLVRWQFAYESGLQLSNGRRSAVWSRVARQFKERFGGGCHREMARLMAAKWARHAELAWPIVRA